MAIILGKIILYAVLVYLGLGLYMFVFQKNYIFFPEKEITLLPSSIGLVYEDLALLTEDHVKIHGWYIPAKEKRATILFFHGNAGNISGRLSTIDFYHQLGLDVYIIDYRGYGKSEGSPSEKGLYLDAKALWNYVTGPKGENKKHVIVSGRSLGGAVAAWLAKEFQPGALILQGTFTSAAEMGRVLYPYLPIQYCIVHRFPTIEFIKDVISPVLVMHSPEDEVVPYLLGQKVFEAAHEPKYFLSLAGSHGEVIMASDDYYRHQIEQFVKDHVGTP